MNHTPISPAKKPIKAQVCSAKNPTAVLKKLKMAPTTLPTIASTIVEIVIERAVSIDKIVVPCSRNKLRILSANNYFYQEPFQGFV